jgi:hypothetical protein
VEIVGEAARFASSRDQYKAEASPTRQLANEQLTKPAHENLRKKKHHFNLERKKFHHRDSEHTEES